MFYFADSTTRYCVRVCREICSLRIFLHNVCHNSFGKREHMKIIKRNGSEAVFDIMKIISAVTRANNVVEEADRLTPMQIRRIAESVELSCQSMNRALSKRF